MIFLFTITASLLFTPAWSMNLKEPVYNKCRGCRRVCQEAAIQGSRLEEVYWVFDQYCCEFCFYKKNPRRYESWCRAQKKVHLQHIGQLRAQRKTMLENVSPSDRTLAFEKELSELEQDICELGSNFPYLEKPFRHSEECNAHNGKNWDEQALKSSAVFISGPTLTQPKDYETKQPVLKLTEKEKLVRRIQKVKLELEDEMVKARQRLADNSVDLVPNGIRKELAAELRQYQQELDKLTGVKLTEEDKVVRRYNKVKFQLDREFEHSMKLLRERRIAKKKKGHDLTTKIATSKLKRTKLQRELVQLNEEYVSVSPATIVD